MAIPDTAVDEAVAEQVKAIFGHFCANRAGGMPFDKAAIAFDRALTIIDEAEALAHASLQKRVCPQKRAFRT